MTKGQRSIINLLAIVAVVLTANLDAATPTNKLTNPGFETGDFAGWTVGGNSIQMGVDTDGTMIPNADPPFPPNFVNVRSDTYAGHALVRQNSVERIVLSQTVSVLPNNIVDVGFWLGNDSAHDFGININDGHLQIFVDGVGLLPDDFVNNGPIGSSPADFHLFSGSFNTGNRTSITVDFAITGSGTSRVGVSFDDFFFITELLPPCPEDLDGDGNVFVTDLLALLMDFGNCDGSPADFDGDGCVTVVDLLTLLGNWGPCPGSPCIWDVNGDGIVDHTDLQQVLGNLGPCNGCPEDVNGDGVVNGQDAVAVATHFGPCP